jgi:hypothetical protein
MSLIHADNFGFYTSSQYSRIYTPGGFGAVVQIGPYGAGGGPGLRFSGDHAYSVERLNLTTVGAVCVMQADVRISQAPSVVNVLLAPLLGGLVQCSLDIDTDGKLKVYRGFNGSKTLLGTSTYEVPFGTRIHIGVKFTIANGTAGSIVVHVWEAGDLTPQVVLNVTGVDTQDLSSAAWDGFNLGAGCAGQTDWSNFVVMDGAGARLNDLLGMIDLITLRPNARAAASLNDFSLSAGSSVPDLIKDPTPDDDVTYLYGNGADQRQSTFVDEVPHPDRAVLGWQSYAYMRRGGNASRTVSPLVRHGGVNYLGPSAAPGSSYAYLMQPHSVMPDGSAVTAAAFDELEHGIQTGEVVTFYVPVTIPASSVGSTLTDFPVYVDLSTLPDAFWEHVAFADGRDLRVTDEADVDLPFDLVAIDRNARTGALFVKTTLSDSVDTTVRLHYGDATLSAVAAGAPNGRDAVWSDYHRVFFFSSSDGYADHAGNGSAFAPSMGASLTPNTLEAGAGVRLNSGYGKATGLTRYTTWTIGISYALGSKAASNVAVSYTIDGTTDDSKRVSIGWRLVSDRNGSWQQADGFVEATAAPSLEPTVYRLHDVHDGTSSRKFYENGVLKATDATITAMPAVGADALYFGVDDASLAGSFVGGLGFFYLRAAVLSDDWIAAEVLNLHTPSSFYTVGNPVTVS